MYRYSTLPPEAYKLTGVPVDEISVIMSGLHREAVWNLFWLSFPSIDKVPAAGPRWWEHHQPVLGALPAIIMDVHEDVPLQKKLVLHPYVFSEWWDRQDHSIFDTYEVMGEQAWVDTVSRRAESAAERMTKEDPPVIAHGNVVKINFRRFG